MDNRSKVTYDIPCKNCPKRYKGETKQKVYHRRSQHKRDIKNKKVTDATALSQHAVIDKHDIDFNKMKITNFIPNYFARRTAESLEIMKYPATMNKKDTGKTTELRAYENIFKKHPKTR